MLHRRSTTLQGFPSNARRKSTLRLPSDNSLYSGELFPSEGLNARQRNTDIKLKLKVKSRQSITSLVDELEKDEYQDLFARTDDLRAATSESYRDKTWDRDQLSVYRGMLAVKMTETHDNLDKLIWDMQDALDQIVAESQKQVDCLDEIEDLFDFVKKGKQKSTRISLPSEERHTELSTEALSPAPNYAPKLVTTAEKGTQCNEFVEDTFSLSLLENRHCQYMFEVFTHLRFVLEILSPIEIDRPDKSKYIPEINSEFYAEHRLRLKGTIFELNSQLVDLALQPKVRPGNLIVPRGGLQRTLSKVGSSVMSPTFGPELPISMPRGSLAKPFSQSKLMKDLVSSKSRGTIFVPTQLPESLQLNLNLKLKTLDPYLMQQTRPLPQFFQAATKVKYAEIERIQILMPEVADLRFNISDVLRPEMRADEFYVNSYFMMGKKDLSDVTLTRVDQDVKTALQIYRFLIKRRSYLRLLFLSYNLESMTAVSDVLSMDFATFVRVLKDCLLISPAFGLLAAAKVYYLSIVKSKELPESGNEESQKKWFKHLLNSYNFKTNYRLRLSGFIESMVRLTYYHPRFQKLINLQPAEKLALLYKRNLKPNARLTPCSLYSSLLRDLHISALLTQFESNLYDIFKGYMNTLTVNERLSDFIGKDKKIDLLKFYSFLGNAGVLIDAEIVTEGNRDIEEEIDELNDLHHGEAKREQRTSAEFRKNQPHYAARKSTTIRFPSSMIDKAENQNMIMRASKNIRQVGNSRDMVILPFYRPVRSMLQIDKLTAFSFFLTVMKSLDTVFLMNPSSLSDSDFCINFSEFCDLMGVLGILYWKTVSKCLDMSLVEGVATFIKSVTEKFRYMREFMGLSQSEKSKLCIELLKQTAGTVDAVQTRPLLTKSMIPQERFVQRRDSI